MRAPFFRQAMCGLKALLCDDNIFNLGSANSATGCTSTKNSKIKIARLRDFWAHLGKVSVHNVPCKHLGYTLLDSDRGRNRGIKELDYLPPPFARKEMVRKRIYTASTTRETWRMLRALREQGPFDIHMYSRLNSTAVVETV